MYSNVVTAIDKILRSYYVSTVHGHEISCLGIEMIQVEGDSNDCRPAVRGPKG